MHSRGLLATILLSTAVSVWAQEFAAEAATTKVEEHAASANGSSSAAGSITTAILTESVTITTVLTITTKSGTVPAPTTGGYDVIKPIEYLPKPVQTAVFTCLANSKCKPSDYVCICADLKSFGVDKLLTGADKDAYLKFQDSICTAKPSAPVYPVATPFPTNNGTSAAPPAPPGTAKPPPPPPGTTKPPPPPPTTSPAVIVPPIVPSTIKTTAATTAPPISTYTGAATLLSVQNAVLAGGVGLMGLVFAGL